MRAVLLSAGPSVRHFDQRTPRNVTIAVNAAAAVFPCDWWCAGDAQTVRRHACERRDLIGSPKVFSIGGMREEFGRDNPEADRFEWLLWEVVRDARNLPQHLLNYSAPMAVALAVHLGASELLVHGVDMHGDADVTGERHRRFNDTRWTRERADWAQVCDWAATHRLAVQMAGSEVACP